MLLVGMLGHGLGTGLLTNEKVRNWHLALMPNWESRSVCVQKPMATVARCRLSDAAVSQTLAPFAYQNEYTRLITDRQTREMDVFVAMHF